MRQLDELQQEILDELEETHFSDDELCRIEEMHRIIWNSSDVQDLFPHERLEQINLRVLQFLSNLKHKDVRPLTPREVLLAEYWLIEQEWQRFKIDCVIDEIYIGTMQTFNDRTNDLHFSIDRPEL